MNSLLFSIDTEDKGAFKKRERKKEHRVSQRQIYRLSSATLRFRKERFLRDARRSRERERERKQPIELC